MKKIFISILAIFLLSSCGGGGGGSSTQTPNTNQKTDSYLLKTGKNSALMGALKGANVKVYKFMEIDKLVEETTTGDLGDFSLSLNGISDDELMFVIVSGGEDIDSNDDGIIDKTPTPNKGAIHAFIKASSLKSGNGRVTLISEIVYQYTKHLIRQTNSKDMLKAMAIISSKLFKNTTLSADEYIKIVNSFNPTSTKDKSLLSFKYSDILSGDNSLNRLIYQNSKSVEDRVDKLFSSVLVMSDSRLFKSVDNLKLTLMPPMHANISSNGSSIFVDKNRSKLYDYIAKDSNVSLNISVESGYKILKWNGCDRVSTDLRECFIQNINSNRVVAPIVVYNEIKYNPNIILKNITGAKITIENNTTYRVETTNLDTSMQSKLANIEVGDVIINQTQPVFFKQVKSITKTDNNNYSFNVATIPLEKIVTQGYISSSLNSAKSSKPLLRYTPNSGKSFKIAQNSDGSYDIPISTRQEKTTFSIDGIEVKKKEWVLLKDANGEDITKIIGSVSVKPYIDLDMGWTWTGGLEMIYIKPAIEIKPNITFEIAKEWKGFKEIQIASLSMSQVFLIGIIPIEVTEEARLLLGVEGNIKLSYTMGGEFGIDVGFPFYWVKNKGLSIKEKHTISAKITPVAFGAEGFAGAYINFMPTVTIYGIGIGLANKFGIYGKVQASAGVSLSYDFTKEEAKAEILKAEAEVYLQYQPEFRLIFPKFMSDSDFIKELQKEFETKAPKFPSVKFPIKKWDVSLDYTIKESPIKLKVVGNNIEENIFVGEPIHKTIKYTLKNTGDTDLYWIIDYETLSPNLRKSIKFSQTLEQLKAGETQVVTLTIDSNSGLNTVGNKLISISFDSTDKPQSSDITLAKYLDKRSYNSSFSVRFNVYKHLPQITSPSIQIDKTSGFDKINITFDSVADDIDGYKIYKADYDKTTQKCLYNYTTFTTINGKSNNSYSVLVDSLIGISDLAQKIERGKSYCFNISSYKDKNSLTSVSDFLTTPLVLDIPTATTNDTSLSNGLVAHYKFDGDTKDSSGNGNDGTPYGGVDCNVAGVIGKACSFDGVDDYVEIDNHNLHISNSISISLWRKSKNNTILLQWGEACPDGNRNYKGTTLRMGIAKYYELTNHPLNEDRDKFHVNINSENGNFYDPRIFSVSKETLVEDKYEHLLFVFHNKVLTLYKNGKVMSQYHGADKGGSGNIQTITLDEFKKIFISKATLKIGVSESYCGYNHQFNGFLNGLIDDLRIYNRALNETEIKALYNMGNI